MNNAVLQIPISKELRQQSEKVAADMGFSSLQEVVRVFLNKLICGEITVSFTTPTIKLSAKNERRYQKIVNDYTNGRNITKTNSTQDFFAKLNK